MPAPSARSASTTATTTAAAGLSPWTALLRALNHALLSIPLVRFLRALFDSSRSYTMLPPATPAAHAADADAHAQRGAKAALTLCALPDELVSMCYAPLSAKDLVALESVSRRMHALVSTDAVCWARCARERWGARSSSALLTAASRHAGSWKRLYAQKLPCDAAHHPWIVPCPAETCAMLDLIKGVPSARKPAASAEAGSPRAVSALRMGVARSLSVVLLIDGSSSVTEEDFKAMKSFAGALAASLSATHPDAALALVQFNQHPKVEAPLTPVARGSLRHAISALDQMMGSTDIAAPIRRAREMLADEPLAAAKAIVLLTDGQTHADEKDEAEREARLANKLLGARVFTLGVGREVDVAGLTQVATGREVVPADTPPEALVNGCYFTLRCLASHNA